VKHLVAMHVAVIDSFIASVKQDGEKHHWANMRGLDGVMYEHRLNVKGEWRLLYLKVG